MNSIAAEVFKEISDEQWEVVRAILPPTAKKGRPRADDRRIVNAILFVLKTRVPWNYLPKEYGDDSTANRRLKRWEKEGVWKRVMDRLESLGYLISANPRFMTENWVLA
jgi:transposase